MTPQTVEAHVEVSVESGREPAAGVAMSMAEGREHFQALHASRRTLTRPVVCVAGWRAWPVLAWQLARAIERTTSSPQLVLPVSHTRCGTMACAAGRMVRAVRENFGEGAPGETAEVDVVAVSMGGLAARLAAMERPGEMRLAVKRLFTLATPHRGAKLTRIATPDQASRDMTPGSDFLSMLDAGLSAASYELVCYARLNDWWVGATRTAPEGHTPIWVEPPRWTLSHLLVSRDPRILADVGTRLRGEGPLLRAAGPPPRD